MTEPVKQDGDTIKTEEVNGGQAPVTAVPDAEEVWWQEASKEHGFKSKEDVYKSWSEANKKISEQGEELKNFKIFQENVVPVLDIVLQDEEILKQVKGKMENPNKTPASPAPVDNQKVVPPEDTDTKKYLIDDAVASFEQLHGIDKLDSETQKEVKAKIGAELKKFTTGENTKVSLLKGQLEDAFALAVAKDEKLSAIFNAKEDSLGDYGSLPSQASAVDKEGNIQLTPAQEKVAQRMPGGREAYIKGLKKMQGK
jgi:hypothetical protein